MEASPESSNNAKPAPAPTPTPTRKFGAKWELKYAVAVTLRDPVTHAPSKCVCLMCQAFEREATVGSKRKKTNRIRHFTPPWRPDNMKRHMEQQHGRRWAEYQTLGDSEKRAFFTSGRATRSNEHESAAAVSVAASVGNVAAMASEPTPSAAASAVATQTRCFMLDQDVVQELAGNMLYESASSERRRSAWDAPGAVRVAGFTALHVDNTNVDTNGDEYSHAAERTVDMNESRYLARVESLLQFNLCLKYVSMGISFAQVLTLYQTTVEETGMAMTLHGSTISEQHLTSLCRIACAVNLQTLKDALRSGPGGVWAFALALESGSDAGSSYLDVRLRFERQGVLHNFHLVAIPIRDAASRAGSEHQSDVVLKCLNVVVPNWRSQLAGISTDAGAVAKMPGCAQSLVDRLTQECVAPVYCDYGAAQQLEKVLQQAFDTLCSKRFMQTLTAVTSHLRRQRALIREMQNNVCPKFEEGRWRSMAKVLRWYTENRGRLLRHMDEVLPACTPGPEWWVTVLAVNSIVDRVEVTLSQLRGPTRTTSHQRECLEKLVTDLSKLTGALGPLAPSARVVAVSGDFEVGDFSISPEDTVSFLKEQGSYASNALGFLEDAQPAAHQTAVDATAYFALSIISRTHRVVVDGEASGNPSNVSLGLPPFLPQVLCKMRNQTFAAELQRQRVRLQKCFSNDQIEEIEAQHRALRTAYQLDEAVSLQLDALSPTVSFSNAWKDGRFGGKDCRLLREFCGAIASAASTPHAAANADENELVLINWHRSPFGLSVVDFSLEAILHAQQFASLAQFREC